MKRLALFMLILAGTIAGVTLLAPAAQDPPEFTNHPLPVATTPPPPTLVRDIMDVAVLAVGLALAVVFTYKVRSRLPLVLLMLAMVAYLGFYRKGCVCPVGSVQNVSAALADRTAQVRVDSAAAAQLNVDPAKVAELLQANQSSLASVDVRQATRETEIVIRLDDRTRAALAALSAKTVSDRAGAPVPMGKLLKVELSRGLPWVVLAFFALPLAVTLFFGRVFCGGVCPLGAVQDLLALHPVKIPAWLGGALGIGAWAYLGLAILFSATGAGFVVCQYDPFVSFFRLSGSWLMLAVGLLMLFIGLFVARPYCRFVCPYGALMRPLSAISKWRVKITPDKCIRCRLCEDACPFGAIRPPTPDRPAPERAAHLRLAALLVLWPAMIAGAAALGWGVSGRLAQAHPTVQLAAQIQREDAGIGTADDYSNAFRATRLTSDALAAEAGQVQHEFAIGSALLGGLLGLVIGSKLVSLSVRRRRDDYTADPATCVSCGRCFEYCPVELQRRKGGPMPK